MCLRRVKIKTNPTQLWITWKHFVSKYQEVGKGIIFRKKARDGRIYFCLTAETEKLEGTGIDDNSFVHSIDDTFL